MDDVYFSVIIPAYNVAEYVKGCIEAVQANTLNKGNYEIILSDDGSTDGTLDIAEELKIKIVRNVNDNKKTIGALRNLGAHQSRGNVLVFLDADMIVPDDWLMKVQEYFRKGFVGALGVVYGVPPSAGWVGRTWGNRLHQKFDKVVNVDFLPGGNIFINRSVFEEINGFNENLRTGEDKDLTLRVIKAGYQVISMPDMGVIHLGYDRNLWEFLKKEFWRQGDTLPFTRQWGFSFRTLRNPIMSFWHVTFLCSVVLSIPFLKRFVTFFLIFMWLLPSFVITLKKMNIKSPILVSIYFFFLTFLRWNVSGLSLIRQILRGTSE
jgi:glycosyltransferase involved in cell wall biosynthesis